MSNKSIARTFSLLIFSIAWLASATASAQIRPNVILVYVDDMGIGDASPYRGKSLQPGTAAVSRTLKTPSLERLAAQGMLFTDAHTSSAMCSPSRYSILTGRYPWRTYDKHKVISDWAARPMIAKGRPTLGTLMKDNGYRTAAIGKWHLGFKFVSNSGSAIAIDSANENNWNKIRTGSANGGGYVDSIADGPRAHGFDEFFGIAGNYYDDKNYSIKAYIKNNGFVGVPTWNGGPNPGSRGPGVANFDQQRLGESYINEVLDYIDDHVADSRNAPFFLYYAPNANHEPHDPANQIKIQGKTYPIRNQAKYTDGADAGLRDDLVYENDVALGALLDKLVAKNDPRTGRSLRQSTMIIFTSDNGAERSSGAIRIRGKKGSLYEGGHRVPFLIAWPDGNIPNAATSRASISQVDIYAALANLLNHPMGADEAEDSANILPALLGRNTSASYPRSHPFVMHDDRTATNDLPDDAVLGIREDSFVMMADGTLVNRNKTNGNSRGSVTPIKLFELNADIHQDNNLLWTSQNQWRINTLSEQLLKIHNQGFSRRFELNTGQILDTDGGVDLRNDRNGAIGYEFTVGNTGMAIESLGMWDDAAGDYTYNESSSLSDGKTAGYPNGLSANHTVRLFDGQTKQLLASVTVKNGNSYLQGEFRYVDLPQPIQLFANRTYALTMTTNPGDGDLFHHFAPFTAIGPIPSERVGNFVARIGTHDADYPNRYPDGADGTANRHPDMFRHRMFVGPNARFAGGGGGGGIEPVAITPDGAPVYDPATDKGIFLWRNGKNNWSLRAMSGGTWANYIGSIAADKPFTSVNPHSIESSDSINTGNPASIDFNLNVSKQWDDGFDFVLAANSDACFDIATPGNATVLVGEERASVTPPFSLNDFKACEGDGCHP